MSLLPDAAPPAKFSIRFRGRNIPPKDLIEDLRRVAGAMGGRRLTIALYAEKGKFCAGTIVRRFGTWNEALGAAGLPVSNLWNVPDSALFENLADVWRKLGRQPTSWEMTKTGGFSRFSRSTYKARFGTWHAGLRAFARFIDAAGHRTGAAVPGEGKIGSRKRRRSPRNITWRLRATILIRDNCICRMCGASPAKDPAVTLHVDHIEPWSKGGETREDNLQTLCSVCNIGKGDRMLKRERA
ncbi:MAG: homing endonuclease associated repeat-containing protein [Reyranellales bacterium]